jgi:hypothetical protein
MDAALAIARDRFEVAEALEANNNGGSCRYLGIMLVAK